MSKKKKGRKRSYAEGEFFEDCGIDLARANLDIIAKFYIEALRKGGAANTVKLFADRKTLGVMFDETFEYFLKIESPKTRQLYRQIKAKGGSKWRLFRAGFVDEVQRMGITLMRGPVFE